MPRSTANMLDLSELPAPLRREVRDFAKFLMLKRVTNRKPVAHRFTKLIDEPLIMDNFEIPTRESLYDQ